MTKSLLDRYEQDAGIRAVAPYDKKLACLANPTNLDRQHIEPVADSSVLPSHPGLCLTFFDRGTFAGRERSIDNIEHYLNRNKNLVSECH